LGAGHRAVVVTAVRVVMVCVAAIVAVSAVSWVLGATGGRLTGGEAVVLLIVGALAISAMVTASLLAHNRVWTRARRHERRHHA
jgi:hypothetical protein